MMRKNKLYTVNPWNRNLFDWGGLSNAVNSATSWKPGNTFTVQPQNYVKGLDFATNYNNVGQRFNAIVDSGKNGLGNWKNAVGGGSTSGTGTASNLAGNIGMATAIAGTAMGAFNGANSAYNSGGRPEYSDDAKMTGFAQLDNFLTGGKKSKFGTALVNIGASGMKNLGPYFHGLGAFFSGLTGTAGTIINNLAGYEVENEGAVRQNTNRLSNTHFDAKDLDSLQEQFINANIGVTNLGKVSNGLLTSEGTRQAEKLKREQLQAYDFAMGSYDNATRNILKNQLAEDLSNYAAYGGPLNVLAMGGNKRKYRTTTKDKSGTTTEVYVPGGYIAETITNEGDTIYRKPSDSWWNPFERVSARRVPNGPVTPDYRRLQQEYRDAYKGSTESSNVGVARVKDFINNLLGTSYDYGGPLGFSDNVSAVNYGFMTDYLTEKKRQNDLKNKMTGMTQMPSFMPSYALGGDLQANGSKYNLGQTYDVSEKEANHLKALGYEFTVIG